MTNNLIQKCQVVLKNLVNDIYNDPINKSYSLMGGVPGKILLLTNYSEATGKQKYMSRAIEVFEHLLDNFEDMPHHMTLCDGIAGFGWLVEYMIQNNYMEGDANYLLEDLDIPIDEFMADCLQKGNYDLLHGAIGCGVYFNSRITSPNRMASLTKLVEGLYKIRIEEDSLKVWKSAEYLPEDGTTRRKNAFNMGVAHGLPGIVLFLAQMIKGNIAKDLCKEMILDTVNFILKQEHDFTKYGCYFAQSVPDKNPFSRLAWCYGDLGITFALLTASEVLNRPEWKNKALEIALFTAERRDPEKNHVNSAAICHGAAGLGFMFQKLFQRLKNPILKEASYYWYEQLLTLNTFKDGYGGFKELNYNEKMEEEWLKSVSFLNGSTGIGLCLNSFLNNNNFNNWEALILLNL